MSVPGSEISTVQFCFYFEIRVNVLLYLNDLPDNLTMKHTRNAY